MAFALKYTSTFRQIKEYSTSGEWQIKIYLEGYGGASSEIKTVAGTLSLNRGGDFTATMLATTLSFGVYNETEGQFIEFADASWGDYYVELIKDPNGSPETIFYGYNQTDIYTEPYEQTPYPSQLKFTCGLSHLKYVRFDYSGGTLFKGQKSLIELIRICTNKLPVKLNVREFVNVYEDSQLTTTTDSPLNQTFVDAELFKKMTKKEGGAIEESAFMCYQVLEEILKVFYCHIYQWGGKWYIVRKQEYKDSTMYFRDFLARNGSESTITIDGTGNLTTNKKTVTNNNGAATDIIFPVDAEKEVMPPLNRVKVTFTQQNIDFINNNLIRNGLFNDIDFTAGATTNNGTPSFWSTGSGLDTSTYFAMISAPWIAQNKTFFQFNPNSYKTSSSIKVNNYIQYSKTDVPVGTADKIQIGFSIYSYIENSTIPGGSPAGYDAFISKDAEVRYEVQLKIGSYYLDGNPSVGYSWVLYAARAVLMIEGYGSIGTQNDDFESIDHLSIVTPNLPESAVRDIEIRIFEPHNNIYGWGVQSFDNTCVVLGLGISDVEFTYLPLGIEPVTEQYLYADINEDENYEEINVILGDNSNTISQGALRLSTVLNTDLWNRRGKTENIPILEILIESLGDDRGAFNDILKGKLIGEFDGFNSIEMTVGAITSHYHIENFNLALESYEWNVSLYRLQTFTPVIALTNSVKNLPKTQVKSTSPAANNNPSERIINSPTLIVGSKSTTSGNTTNLTNYN